MGRGVRGQSALNAAAAVRSRAQADRKTGRYVVVLEDTKAKDGAGATHTMGIDANSEGEAEQMAVEKCMMGIERDLRMGKWHRKGYLPILVTRKVEKIRDIPEYVEGTPGIVIDAAARVKMLSERELARA